MSFLGQGLSKMAEQTCAVRDTTIRERLVERQRNLREQLANVTGAIEFIDKNPAFEQFHDAITKVGIY